jgi:AcrR family transcriptional regulator
VFAANGYEATNIDQIVNEAGLARGTFYRYFSDKLELITALAHEAAAVMCPLFDEFAETARTLDDAGLDDWLRRFLATNRRYSGVMRAWTEGFPISPQVLAPCSDVVAAMSRAIMAAFGPPRRYPFERRAAGMLFAGLLEHFPNEATGCVHEPTDDQLVAAQAQFLRRVVLSE